MMLCALHKAIYRQIEVGQFLYLFKSLYVNFRGLKKILLTCFCFNYSSQAPEVRGKLVVARTYL